MANLVLKWEDYTLKEVGTVLGWETTAHILAARDEAKVLPKQWVDSMKCYYCHADLIILDDGSLFCTGRPGHCGRASLAVPKDSLAQANQVDWSAKLIEQGIISRIFGEDIKALEI